MKETQTGPEVSRRTYLAGIAAAGTIGLAGCADSAAATGTLATQVTDQPGDIADFESCVVTIQGIWVKPGGEDDEDDAESADDDTDDEQSEGREYHEFDEPQEADLVELQNGNTQLIDQAELEAREYEFLQLDVTNVAGSLADGGEATVDTPGNAPLQFKQRFEIREDQVTTFVGDFTPVRRGQTDRYLLQPVAQGTRVEYEDTGEDDA